VAADVLQQMDPKTWGAEAVKRAQKKIAHTRSAVATARYWDEGPRVRNRGRGRGGGRHAEAVPAPVHQQQGTRGGRGARGGSRGRSGGTRGGRGSRPPTPGPAPPPSGQ
jgi:uncharacterized membrane protein YgcG